MVNKRIEQESSRQPDLTARMRPSAASLRNLPAAVLSLCICLSFVVAPTGAVAFNCPASGPNCTCYAGPICVEQLHLNNPKYVHIKVYVLGNINGSIWQIIDSRGQTEGNNSDQTYVVRNPDEGITHFSLQRCVKTFTGGTSCNGWQQAYLLEPSVKQLEACQKYADKAVAAVAAKNKLACPNLDGPRWSADPKAHYNACAANPAADAWPSETAARTKDLQACKDMAAAASAPPPPPPPPKGFAGTFAVSMQPLGDFTFVITQQGPGFSGQMVNADPKKNGTLQGSLEPDGSHVKFSYVQPQLNASGNGRFWLEENLDHLAGRYFVDGGNGAVFLLDGKRK